eukprot:gene483-490_t
MSFDAIAAKGVSLYFKASLVTLACFTAYRIRTFPVEQFGALIHEFDPWFNYRASEYLLHNGSERFFKWFDHSVWYPLGRPVGTTIYPGMQFSAVWLHQLFNDILPRMSIATPFLFKAFMPWLPDGMEIGPMSLNDICVYMPCWWAFAATLLLFLWTYECTGKGWASAIAALIFSIIPAHLMRSVAGEFDNECVALAAMVGTFWLWCASVRYEHRWPIAFAAGFAYWYMVASWGGYIFVINMIGVHAINKCIVHEKAGQHKKAQPVATKAQPVAPLLETFQRRDPCVGNREIRAGAPRHLSKAIPFGHFNDGAYKAYTIFYIVGTYLATTIPVVGLTPVKSMEQMGPMGVFLIYQFLYFTELYERRRQHKRSWQEFQIMRLKLALALGTVLAAIVAILLPMGYFGPISSRIRGLFVKHTRTGNPLVDSVAEHQPASAAAYNHYLHNAVQPAFFGFLCTLPGLGASPGKLFLALYCMVSYYFSLRMSRLMIICGPIVATSAGYFIGWAFGFLGNQVLVTSKKYFLGIDDESEDTTKPEDKTEGKDDAPPPLPKKSSSQNLSKRQMKRNSFKKNKSNTTLDFSSLANIQKDFVEYWNQDSFLGTRFLIVTIAFCILFQQTLMQGLEFNAHGHRMAQSLANPQIVFKYRNQRTGEPEIIDDYLKSYLWVKENTPEDARILSWWDYGYQINGIANRTTIADGNTWNHEHIATLGRCMVSPEKRSWNIIRHLADYVLIWAGGSGDDLGKSVHMARISTSVPQAFSYGADKILHPIRGIGETNSRGRGWPGMNDIVAKDPLLSKHLWRLNDDSKTMPRGRAEVFWVYAGIEPSGARACIAKDPDDHNVRFRFVFIPAAGTAVLPFRNPVFNFLLSPLAKTQNPRKQFYDDICPDDPTCSRFGFNSDRSPTEMMKNSMVYKLHSHNIQPGVKADKRLWQEVHTSKHGLVRIFKVLNVSEESKEWVKQNRQCDGGGWFCPGQYPPALDKLFAKRKDFAQLEDFNKDNKEKNAYSLHVEKQAASGGSF